MFLEAVGRDLMRRVCECRYFDCESVGLLPSETVVSHKVVNNTKRTYSIHHLVKQEFLVWPESDVCKVVITLNSFAIWAKDV